MSGILAASHLTPRAVARIAAVVAVIALAYSVVLFTVTIVDESTFFSQHAALKARALSIPAQLTATELAIQAEQHRILAAQAAIGAAARRPEPLTP